MSAEESLQRAEQILARGPDPDYIEPDGGPRAEAFSTCLESGPFPLGTPERYALNKAKLFPIESVLLFWSLMSRTTSSRWLSMRSISPRARGRPVR